MPLPKKVAEGETGLAAYRYKGINSCGKSIAGVIEADDEKTVADMLKAKGYYPVLISPERGVVDIKGWIKDRMYRIRAGDLGAFSRQLASLLEAGITITDSLFILSRQLENPKLKRVLEEIVNDLKKGYRITRAMAKHKAIFPELFINMIEAGEVSGNLNDILIRLAEHYEREDDLKNRLKSAMTYPALLSAVTFGVLIFLVTVVIPVFARLYESMGAPLPLSTRVILDTGRFLVQFRVIIILAAGSLAVFLWNFSRGEKGRYIKDRGLLELPVVGELQGKLLLSRFSRTMSILLCSGVNILEAFDTANKTINNSILLNELNRIAHNVRNGNKICDALRDNRFFPPVFKQMISIGEEAGNLEQMLARTADFYDREIDALLSRISVLIEPFIIIMMGVIIGLVVITVVLPMFNIFSIFV